MGRPLRLPTVPQQAAATILVVLLAAGARTACTECSAAAAAALLASEARASGAVRDWAAARQRVARGTLRLVESEGGLLTRGIFRQVADGDGGALGGVSGAVPLHEGAVTPDALRAPALWRVEAVERERGAAALALRADASTALVVIAGGDSSASYIGKSWRLLRNKAERAHRTGERLYIWTGGLPEPFDRPGEWCLSRGNMTDGVGGWVGCEEGGKTKLDPACPRGASDPRAPSVHFAKMAAALLALDAGCTQVAVIDMDAMFSSVPAVVDQPRLSAFYEPTVSNASVAFLMGHWPGLAHSWAPLGDAFHVFNTEVARDFLLAWLGRRCGLKDQPPLWDLLLSMHAAAGTLAAPYPIRGARIFQANYKHRFGRQSWSRSFGSPFDELLVQTQPASLSCARALSSIPVAYFGGARVQEWEAANDYSVCASRARKAGQLRSVLGNAHNYTAQAPVPGACVLYHIGGARLKSSSSSSDGALSFV